MKKIFLFAAMAAMVLVSCNKNNPSNDPKDPKDDPKEPDKQEYVQPIKIDGDFADWAALDASKIATAKTDPDATKSALKLVKVYADEMFVFVYFEWDKDQIDHEPDVDHVPFHMYINGDGNTATGGFGDEFSDACADVMTEGFIYPDGASVGAYEPGVYKWVGEVNGSGWDSCWEDLGELNGFITGSGIEGKYEIQIVRELYPLGKMADEFSIGFDIQQSWNSVGLLPNAAVTEDNPGGLAPSLKVSTVK